MAKKVEDRQWYSGIQGVKAAGVQHEYTPEEVKEYIKCAQDPAYFINNYVKIVSLDHGLVPFKMRPYQTRIIDAVHANRKVVAMLGRQMGKTLLNQEVIPTPTGFVQMKDINVGSVVLGPDGKPCTVVAATDEHEFDSYRITFDTGESIVCSEDHQWTVYDRIRRTTKVRRTEEEMLQIKNKHQKYKYVPTQLTLTPKQMLERGFRKKNNRGYYEYNFYIPNTEPVDVLDRDIIIDPYALGLWLGDGYSAEPKMCYHQDDGPHYMQFDVLDQQSEKIMDSKRHPTMKQCKFNTRSGLCTANLKQLNLLNNKHIPMNYIFCSKETKVKLLQGLMDTDGFVDEKQGVCNLQFSRKYQGMMETIPIFLKSLGLKVTVRDFEKTNSRRFSFLVTKDDFVPVTIPRKSERIHQSLERGKYVKSRTIVNVENLNKKERGKCIQVDRPDHLYLAGDIFVPTHNSTVMAAYLLWYATFNERKTAVMLANKMKIAQEIFSKIREAHTHLPLFLQQGVVEWNKSSLKYENGSRIVTAATSPTAVRGMSANMLMLKQF